MRIEAGQVAVVTGAAGGIGLGLARAAARRGMKVVLSDIREKALDRAVYGLRGEGRDVIAVRADVTRADEIAALADAAVERFGKVNLLVNNAGTLVCGLAWETSPEEFDWVVRLNLMSIVNGFHAFVPRMIAQGDRCHVVTMGSGASLTVYPAYASYSATKHAALALTEALRLDLEAEGIDTIGVTIAMPGVVATDVMNPEKTSPAALDLAKRSRRANRTVRAIERMVGHGMTRAITPDALAAIVLDAVEKDRLYVLPNLDGEAARGMITAIVQGRARGEDPYLRILPGIRRAMDAADKDDDADLR